MLETWTFPNFGHSGHLEFWEITELWERWELLDLWELGDLWKFGGQLKVVGIRATYGQLVAGVWPNVETNWPSFG